MRCGQQQPVVPRRLLEVPGWAPATSTRTNRSRCMTANSNRAAASGAARTRETSCSACSYTTSTVPSPTSRALACLPPRWMVAQRPSRQTVNLHRTAHGSDATHRSPRRAPPTNVVLLSPNRATILLSHQLSHPQAGSVSSLWPSHFIISLKLSRPTIIPGGRSRRAHRSARVRRPRRGPQRQSRRCRPAQAVTATAKPIRVKAVGFDGTVTAVEPGKNLTIDVVKFQLADDAVSGRFGGGGVFDLDGKMKIGETPTDVKTQRPRQGDGVRAGGGVVRRHRLRRHAERRGRGVGRVGGAVVRAGRAAGRQRVDGRRRQGAVQGEQGRRDETDRGGSWAGEAAATGGGHRTRGGGRESGAAALRRERHPLGTRAARHARHRPLGRADRRRVRGTTLPRGWSSRRNGRASR